MKKIYLILITALFLMGAGCTQTNKGGTYVSCTADTKQCPDGTYAIRTEPNCDFTPCSEKTTSTVHSDWKTITIGGVVNFQIPPNCSPDPGAGSTYIICPTTDNKNPDAEFVFSSDGIQVNMRRWKNKQSPYWNDVLASMKVIQPLDRTIQINIEK